MYTSFHPWNLDQQDLETHAGLKWDCSGIWLQRIWNPTSRKDARNHQIPLASTLGELWLDLWVGRHKVFTKSFGRFGVCTWDFLH